MNEPSGKKTCGHSDNFTFEAVPDARGKENSAKKPGKIKLARQRIIWLLFVASSPFLAVYFLLYLGFAEPAWWTDFLKWLRPEEKVAFIPGPPYEGPHTMLFLGGDDPLKSSFAHPLRQLKTRKKNIGTIFA